MVQINWTNQAVFDLKEIAAYISKDSKKYARLQVKRIKVRTHILKTNPFSGPSIDFFENPNIRQLTVGSFIIVYKIVDHQRIDILTIHHTARDLGKRKIQP